LPEFKLHLLTLSSIVMCHQLPDARMRPQFVKGVPAETEAVKKRISRRRANYLRNMHPLTFCNRLKAYRQEFIYFYRRHNPATRPDDIGSGIHS
jgi:hypothetical protein